MNQTPTISESGFFNGGVDALSQATSSIGINAKLSDDESKTSKKRFKAYRDRLRQLNDQTISESQLVNSARNSFNPSPGFVSKTALANNNAKETFHEIGASSEAEQTHFRADNNFNHGMISSDTNEWSQSMRERSGPVQAILQSKGNTYMEPNGQIEEQKMFFMYQ